MGARGSMVAKGTLLPFAAAAQMTAYGMLSFPPEAALCKRTTFPTAQLTDIDLHFAIYLSCKMQHSFSRSGKRSACPINAVVEVVGDQWSFLILRDILLLERSRYTEFKDADEGVATNILAKRLKHLMDHGLIERHQDPADGRGSIYLPTDRALDLIPVLLAMIAWSDRHQPDAKKYAELMALYAMDPSGAATLLRGRAQALRKLLRPQFLQDKETK